MKNGYACPSFGPSAVIYWALRGFFGCHFAVNGHPPSVAALTAMGKVINGHLG